MQTLELLAMAMGLAALAGLNLYLTVFAVSVSLNMGWVVLDPSLASLQILSHPVILTVSGILTFIEFFADKISWVDSLWDSIHTVIRPVGAAFLAVAVLGQADPIMEIVLALLCGGVALTTHATKAGVRLLVNTAPEPFSNIVVSSLENIGVIGGLMLLWKFPLIVLTAVILFVIAFCFLAPKLLRAVWVTFRYIFHAIFRFAFGSFQDTQLSNTLPVPEREQIASDLGAENITWAVPALTGKNPKLRKNKSAFLVFIKESEKVGLVVRRQPNRWLTTDSLEVHANRRFLFDELSLYHRASGASIVVRFFKSRHPVLEKVLSSLRGEEENPSSQLPTTVLGSFR